MTTPELKEYLSMVVDMEKSIYFEEALIEANKARISTLGGKKNFTKPQKGQGEPLEHGGIIFLAILAISILSGIVSANFFVSLGVFLILALIFGIVEEVSGRKKAKAQYRLDLQEYNNKLQKDSIRVTQENQLKDLLTEGIKNIESRIAESKKALEKIYGANIIFPKYRNLVAVCSLYEYLCSGRCDTLEGANGAYNLFENEVKMNMIILQLDRIAQSLEQIKANQYMLYSAIQESNQRANQIASRLDQLVQAINSQAATEENINQRLGEIQKAAELNAYHAERVQKELAYMNRVNYYSGRNDAAGPFRSIPPTW